MLAIQPMLSKGGARLHPRTVCRVGEQYQATNGAAVCTLIANENIRDLHPKLVGDTEANSPLLEPIDRLGDRLPGQKKRS